MRPAKVLAQTMYSASSSLRAWTLRLPSVVFSRRLRSLKVSDSLTASALTIPSRSRSCTSRSSSSGDSFLGGATAPSDFRLLPSDFKLLCLCALATVAPRDDEAEDDVQTAEAGSHEPMSVRGGDDEGEG